MKKHIVFVVEGGNFSGMPIRALKLAQSIRGRGCAVTCIISPEREGFLALARSYGVPVVVMRLRRLRASLHPRYLAASLLIPFDLVRLGLALRRLGATEVHSFGPHHFLGPVAAKGLGLDVVWYLGATGGLRRSLNNALHKLVLWLADVVAPNCLAVRDFALENGRPRGRVVVVPNLIDVVAFSPGDPAGLKVAELGIREGDIVVSTVATIYPTKGVDVFIRAAATLAPRDPRLRFLVVGPELELHRDYGRMLRKLVHRLGVQDRVVFAGARTDVPLIMRRSRVLAVSSHSEGFPGVVLEGMATGTPVAATAVGGIPEIISHERTGLLVPPGDHAALAEAIWRLTSDDELHRRISLTAREEVVARYSADRIAAQVVELIERDAPECPDTNQSRASTA